MSNAGYEFFEHTADTGLRVHGQTFEALLVRAAQGLITLLVEDSPIAVTESRSVALSAASPEGLLRTWLNEVLFWFATDRFLPGDYHLNSVTDTSLQGRVLGERFDPTRHQQGIEVKGITYHRFHVARTPDGWEAEIIFDV